VPVYPPSSRGFQSALYKMVHIAKDCEAAGILTSAVLPRISEDQSHPKVGSRRPASTSTTSPVFRGIVTEAFRGYDFGRTFFGTSKILFSPIHSGSYDGAQGVMVTHENILQTCPLVIDHPNPVVVSWLPAISR